MLPSYVPPKKPMRKVGGQPGNQNAYQHGFYTIRAEIRARLGADLKGGLDDEVDALRSVAETTLVTFNECDHPTLEQCQTTLRGLSLCFGTMKGIYLMQKILNTKQPVMLNILQELADIPPEED
jgi:hypothetical protein